MQRHFGGNLAMDLSIYEVMTWNFGTWFESSSRKKSRSEMQKKKKSMHFPRLKLQQKISAGRNKTFYSFFFCIRFWMSCSACLKSRVKISDPNFKNWVWYCDIVPIRASCPAQLAPALPALPCCALRYRVPRACFVCLLEFNVEEIMYK